MIFNAIILLAWRWTRNGNGGYKRRRNWTFGIRAMMIGWSWVGSSTTSPQRLQMCGARASRGCCRRIPANTSAAGTRWRASFCWRRSCDRRSGRRWLPSESSSTSRSAPGRRRRRRRLSNGRGRIRSRCTSQGNSSDVWKLLWTRSFRFGTSLTFFPPLPLIPTSSRPTRFHMSIVCVGTMDAHSPAPSTGGWKMPMMSSCLPNTPQH